MLHTEPVQNGAPPRASVRILMVENDPRVVEDAHRELERFGLACQLRVAGDAESFGTAVQAQRPDLILGEFRLSRFDGLQAMGLAKALCPEVPFILLAADAEEPRAVELMARGAADCLSKTQWHRLGPSAIRAIDGARLAAKVRQLEEQLRQANKSGMIGQLAGGIAHDFNNILTAILGFSDLILGRRAEEASSHGEVMEIREAALRGARLTRQLLSFTRKHVAEPARLDLNEVVCGMEGMLRRLVGETIELILNRQSDLAPVEADRSAIEQILMNLVVNARDAMPGGGRLRISTRTERLDRAAAESLGVKPGPHVRLDIADSGHGMAPEVRKRLFEPFFTTKPEGAGSGLGLSMVARILGTCGGSIRIDSEVGHGSIVSIYLPEARVDAAVQAPSEGTVAPPPRSGGGDGRTILVAEDDSSVRDLMARILTREKFTALIAAGADEARRLSEHSGSIDLLIADSVMPGMSGLELARSVAGRHPGVSVLIISGYLDQGRFPTSSPELVFLQKPFTADQLLEKVREILGAKSR